MLEENIRKTEEAAKKAFPYEQWDNAMSLEFKYEGKDFELPDRIDNIKVARSRLTGLKDACQRNKAGKNLIRQRRFNLSVAKDKRPGWKKSTRPRRFCKRGIV